MLILIMYLLLWRATPRCPTWTVQPAAAARPGLAAFSLAKAERDAVVASGHIFRGRPE